MSKKIRRALPFRHSDVPSPIPWPDLDEETTAHPEIARQLQRLLPADRDTNIVGSSYARGFKEESRLIYIPALNFLYYDRSLIREIWHQYWVNAETNDECKNEIGDVVSETKASTSGSVIERRVNWVSSRTTSFTGLQRDKVISPGSGQNLKSKSTKASPSDFPFILLRSLHICYLRFLFLHLSLSHATIPVK